MQTRIDELANNIFDQIPIEQQTREAFRYCIETARRQLEALGYDVNRTNKTVIRASTVDAGSHHVPGGENCFHELPELWPVNAA